MSKQHQILSVNHASLARCMPTHSHHPKVDPLTLSSFSTVMSIGDPMHPSQAATTGSLSLMIALSFMPIKHKLDILGKFETFKVFVEHIVTD
jgi:hypothetical protein